MKRESSELGNALGCAHDTGGIDGLVGGDEDELFGAVTDCGLCERKGSDGVVLDGRKWMKLHERDVLEGGGMEDDVRTMMLEGFFKRGYVTDAGEDRRVRSGEFAVDLKQGLFGGVEEQNPRGIIGRDGVCEGRADGAAGSGDEDALSPDRMSGNWDRFGRE